MNQSIDYQELIDELKDEIGTGSLAQNEIIQILRSEQANANDYHMIIDWYYNKDVMTVELSPDDSDDPDEIANKRLLKQQYQKDKAYLEEIITGDCLKEMFEKTIKVEKKAKNKHNKFF